MTFGRRSTIVDVGASAYIIWALILSCMALVESLMSFFLPGWILGAPFPGFSGYWISCSDWYHCSTSILLQSPELNEWWMPAAGAQGVAILCLIFATGFSIRLLTCAVHLKTLKGLLIGFTFSAGILLCASIVVILVGNRMTKHLIPTDHTIFYCLYINVVSAITSLAAGILVCLHKTQKFSKRMSMPPNLDLTTSTILRASISIEPSPITCSAVQEEQMKKKQYF